jgi:hypothetical protein
LIEAIVAFAALALVAIAAFELLAGAARGTRAAERHQAVLMVAEARLAEAGPVAPLVAGLAEGSADGVAWRREIAPYGDVRPTGAGTAPLLRLFEINVTAEADGRRVALTRLAVAPPAR